MLYVLKLPIIHCRLPPIQINHVNEGIVHNNSKKQSDDSAKADSKEKNKGNHLTLVQHWTRLKRDNKMGTVSKSSKSHTTPPTHMFTSMCVTTSCTLKVYMCHIWMVAHIKGESGLELCKTTAAKHTNMKRKGIRGVGGQMASWVTEKRLDQGNHGGRRERRKKRKQERCEDKYPSPDVDGSARWMLDDATPASCSCSLAALFPANSQEQHC